MSATQWAGGWMGPIFGLNDSQHLLTLPEIKHPFLSHPGHRLVTIVTRLSSS